jgi:Domain of unknown function (DUF397)
MDTQLNWRKSTFSGQGNSCVEVADLPDNGRAVRDSKREDSPVLTFNAAEWRAFVQGIRAGEFD